MNFEKDDLLGFWKSIYPELSNNELNDFLLAIMGCKLEELYDRITLEKKESSFFEKKLDKELEEIVCNDPILMEKSFINFLLPIFNKHFQILIKAKNLEIIEHSTFLKETIRNTYNSLYEIIIKTMIQEIELLSNNNKLLGKTSEDRFSYYTTILLKNESYLKEFYTDYFVLIELLDIKVRYIFEFCKAFITSTNKNCELIMETIFGESAIREISGFDLGEGDTHAKGKSVVTLFFGSTKVIYKPRNMNIESNFSALLGKVSEAVDIDLQGPKIVSLNDDSGTHGWSEFIASQSLASLEDGKLYYKRIGMLLCILYSVNGTDFHNENLIASGEFPILIDIETLFHSINFSEDTYKSIFDFIENKLKKSVTALHLLPNRILLSNDPNANIWDVGGIGDYAEQFSPIKIPIIQNMNTDEMFIEKDYVPLSLQNNAPEFHHTFLNAYDYVKEIKEGFQLIYDWILDNKKGYIKLIASLFENNKARVIMKPTMIYARTLSASYHPDAFLIPFGRELILNRIYLANPSLDEKWLTLAQSELQDLKVGDIPIFYSQINTKSLFNSFNEEVKSSFYTESPIDEVFHKIQDFSAKDKMLQCSLIDLSFLHAKNDVLNSIFEDLDLNDQLNVPIVREDYLQKAISLGQEIMAKSEAFFLEGEKQVTWYGLDIQGKNELLTQISSVGCDLYKGNAGTAIFFANLYAETLENEYKENVIEILRPVIQILEDPLLFKEHNLEIGAFTGVSGMIYALYHAGKLLAISEFENRALVCMESVAAYVLTQKDTVEEDVIGGLSGCIAVALSMYKEIECSEESKKLEDILIDLTNKLTDQLIEEIETDKLLADSYTGFGHGTAGISAVLAQVYDVMPLGKIKEKIEKIIDYCLSYERQMFSIQENNWEMSSHQTQHVSRYWCHGSAGILLNRVLLRKHGFHDSNFKEEMNIAIDETKKGIQLNTTLCHGALGNLLILDLCSKELKDDSLKVYVAETYHKIILHLYKNEENRDFVDNDFLGSLMIGNVGIGYSLLYMFDQEDKIKKILFLE